MSFDKPKSFIYAARNFREYVGSVGIPQLFRLLNRFAGFMSEGGQSFGNGFHMRVAIGDVQRILFQARACGCDTRSALSNAAELHDALSAQIHITLDRLINLIEKFVQTDEVGAFDVPMRLLELQLQVNAVRKPLIEDAD